MKVSKVNECRNELEWSAFCYASGELSPAEAEQFEARLADEQEAREALARAVELTQIVAAAESQCEEPAPSLARRVSVTERSSSSWAARISWMAVGGLAAALLAMVWSGGLSQFGSRPERAEISSENSALATAWSATRDSLREAMEEGPLHPLSAGNGDAGNGNPDEETPRELTDELVVADAPSWMTAAVEGLASEMDQDESGSDEPLVN